MSHRSQTHGGGNRKGGNYLMQLQGSKKKPVKMPMCQYGAGCTRKDCIYRHPPKVSRDQEAIVIRSR